MRYLIDTHTHTIASGHAYNTIDEMTKKASEIGLRNLAITEHAPKMPGSCHKLYFNNLRVLPREKMGVNRLFGCELNILDYTGKVDLSEKLMDRMDILIASIHTPCIKSGTIDENTASIVNCMNNPYINIIGHPDDARYPLDYEVIVKEALKTHTLLELNNNSLNPNGPRQGAWDNDIKMLELCKKYNVCISLASDAHVEEDIMNFTNCEKILSEINFPDRLIANLDMDLFNSFLKGGKCVE